MAEAIREHFRRNLYENVAGGAGISVIFRSVCPALNPTPLPIDLDEAETTAIFVLSEANLSSDLDYVAYVKDIAKQTENRGLHTG